jgi:hypothetical protein
MLPYSRLAAFCNVVFDVGGRQLFAGQVVRFRTVLWDPTF